MADVANAAFMHGVELLNTILLGMFLIPGTYYSQDSSGFVARGHACLGEIGHNVCSLEEMYAVGCGTIPRKILIYVHKSEKSSVSSFTSLQPLHHH